MNRDEIVSKLSLVSPDTENAIELSSMLIFEELGWDIVYAEHEVEGDQAILGRTSHSQVVLFSILYSAIKELNPLLPKVSLEMAMDEISRDRTTMDIAKANKQVYKMIKDGVVTTFRDDDGIQQTERVKLIDWNNPENNQFTLVSQMWVQSDIYRKRPDLIGFVNGIPLLFMELKNSTENVKNAYDDNLRDYKDTIPHLFWYNGLVILSNGREAKAGSITAEWEHFADWKKINDEGETGIIDLDTIIRGTCSHEKLCDIVENFTIFMDIPGGMAKLVSKNHQYLGVNNAIKAVGKAQDSGGRLGVFWHTQGSGKSASMIWFSQKVLRKIRGNWTFVIITDRVELDNQIYETFHNAGALTEDKVQATSTKNLRELLH